MKLKELKALLANEPKESDEMEIKVWLPGTTLTLSSGPGWPCAASLIRRGEVLMIEASLDSGSALEHSTWGHGG